MDYTFTLYARRGGGGEGVRGSRSLPPLNRGLGSVDGREAPALGALGASSALGVFFWREGKETPSGRRLFSTRRKKFYHSWEKKLLGWAGFGASPAGLLKAGRTASSFLFLGQRGVWAA